MDKLTNLEYEYIYSEQSLFDIIRLEEDTKLGLKTISFQGKQIIGPSRNDLADEIAAIVNTHEGLIVLGVDDKNMRSSVEQSQLDKIGILYLI